MSDRWPVGEAEVQNLIDEGEIEEVEPSQEHADLLMRQAEVHLASAPALLPGDPPGAFAVLYDAARRAMSAVLAKQGLRATSKSGHRATQEALSDARSIVTAMTKFLPNVGEWRAEHGRLNP